MGRHPLLPRRDFLYSLPVIHDPDVRGVSRGSRNQDPTAISLDPYLPRRRRCARLGI